MFGDATLGGAAEVAAASDIIFIGVSLRRMSIVNAVPRLGVAIALHWKVFKSIAQCSFDAQVKPQYLDGILEALRPHVTSQHLIISIAAGVRIASLEANLPEGTRVVRPAALLSSLQFVSLDGSSH